MSAGSGAPAVAVTHVRARLLILLAVVLSCCAVEAAVPLGKQAASPWARGNRLQLAVTQEAIGFSGQWQFERFDNGEIRIEKDESRAGRQAVGTVLVVGDGALATHKLRPTTGRELDEVNGPLSMLQLSMRLLERAAPGGPGSVTKNTEVQMGDDKQGILVTGLGAEGEFFAPWRVRGSIAPAPEGRIKFQFEFTSSRQRPGAKAYITELIGIWESAPSVPALPVTLSLLEWRVHQITQIVKPRGQFNTIGLGAGPPQIFASLGDLRQRVASWGTDAERRSRLQCN